MIRFICLKTFLTANMIDAKVDEYIAEATIMADEDLSFRGDQVAREVVINKIIAKNDLIAFYYITNAVKRFVKRTGHEGHVGYYAFVEAAHELESNPDEMARKYCLVLDAMTNYAFRGQKSNQ